MEITNTWKKINGEEYNELDSYFGLGTSIESCLCKLKNQSKLTSLNLCYKFNAEYIHSNMTVDDAYLTVLNKTKSDFDKGKLEYQREYQREEKEHKKNIPFLIKKWVKIGHETLDSKYYEEWDKCVPVRLADLYRGMELGCLIKIVKQLNDSVNFNIIKEELDEQGHSGMSYGLVCVMIKAFHDNGSNFINYINKKGE